jgi:hypothetical protein
MKNLKMLGLAAVAAMALMAIGAGSASATTLEVKGVTQSGAVTIKGSLELGTSTVLQTTTGAFLNTCSESSMEGKSTVFTGTVVTVPLSALSFKKCTSESVVVDKPGTLTIERIGTTTNGTVKSSGAEVTVPSPLGQLTCTTGTGIDIGTLTGKATGFATVDVLTAINCGFLVPSASWVGSYWITSPEGLGVVG